MNLLVTNSQDIQAYIIVRSLRDHAERVVVTSGGHSVGTGGFPGVAVFSRHVNGCYQVPHFSRDWLAARISRENSPDEESYVQEIERICAREAIDDSLHCRRVTFLSEPPNMALYSYATG